MKREKVYVSLSPTCYAVPLDTFPPNNLGFWGRIAQRRSLKSAISRMHWTVGYADDRLSPNIAVQRSALMEKFRLKCCNFAPMRGPLKRCRRPPFVCQPPMLLGKFLINSLLLSFAPALCIFFACPHPNDYESTLRWCRKSGKIQKSTWKIGKYFQPNPLS